MLAKIRECVRIYAFFAVVQDHVNLHAALGRGSQVVFGLLSDHVAARELLAGAGAVVLLYAGLWWLAARRVPPPGRLPAARPLEA